MQTHSLSQDGWGEVAALLALVVAVVVGGGGGGKINGHSRGRHKGLLKVYCHKH